MIDRQLSSTRRILPPVLFAAALAACSIASQVETAHAQTASPLPVTVELGDVSLTKLPIIIAADNGIFDRNGLKVDMFITPRAAEAVRSAGVIVPPENIRSGAIGDISVTGGSPMVVETTTIATAPRRTILAPMDNVVRFHIITRADITKPEQLKGKRIGYTVRGALTDYSTLLYLQELHLDPVQDVAMYSSGSTVAGDEISVEAAKKAGMNDLVDLSRYNWPMAGSGLMALSSWLPNNHEAAQLFVKSIVEAIVLMKTDKKAAAASLAKWFGMKDPAKIDAVYASAKYLPSKPYPSVEGLQMMHKVYNWRALNISKPEDFEDSSYVAALDKSGFIDSLYKDAKAALLRLGSSLPTATLRSRRSWPITASPKTDSRRMAAASSTLMSASREPQPISSSAVRSSSIRPSSASGTKRASSTILPSSTFRRRFSPMSRKCRATRARPRRSPFCAASTGQSRQ